METSDEVTVPVSVLRTVADILRDERPPSLGRDALDALASRLEALLPKENASLHEVIFWEIRSGPTRDEREWADWLMALCTERIRALPVTMGDTTGLVAYDQAEVLALFVIPEGREAKQPERDINPTCRERWSHPNPGHGWIQCQQPLGHEGDHYGNDGLLDYRLTVDPPLPAEMTETSCPAHEGHRWCRRTRGHVGYHVDTQGNSFGKEA